MKYTKCSVIYPIAGALLLLTSQAPAQEVKYQTSPATGRILSVIAAPKHPRMAAAAVKDSAKKSPARAEAGTVKDFVKKHAPAFGVEDPDAELRLNRSETDQLGMTHMRYRQAMRGIPVFGAEVVAHVNRDGEVQTLNGAAAAGVSAAGLLKRNKVRARRAGAIVSRAFAKRHPRVTPSIKSSSLEIYQPGLINNSNDLSSFLVWKVQAVSEKAWIDEEYLVDSATGEILRWFDNVRRLNRYVYDCSSKPGTDICSSNTTMNYINDWLAWNPPPESYTFGCREGLCPRGIPNPRYPEENNLDSDNMYTLLGDVHNYYQIKFGRDGANGQGGNTDGTMFPPSQDAGWVNINWLSGWSDDCQEGGFWRDQGVALCKDLVQPDIVGHEYAHGINANLVYDGESGALEESHSDVIGEMFEYWQGTTNDWVFGGDLVSNPGKRNIADPPSYVNPALGIPNPDRFYSSYYNCNTSSLVHHNSTVPSKALYLASMGGTFNGCTISPITREKVEKILYRAKTQYYIPTETFNGAYLHLIQSCLDLFGEASSDCRELVKALQAVELDQPGICADPTQAGRHAPKACGTDGYDEVSVSIGGPQRVYEGDTVFLQAVGSDSWSLPLNYRWEQISGPMVNLSSANTADASFTAPMLGELDSEISLSFQVTADNGHGVTATDTDAVVQIYRLGDSNHDGYVGPGDLNALVGSWSACAADSGYSLSYDLNRNGCVDLPDVLIFAHNWKKGS